MKIKTIDLNSSSVITGRSTDPEANRIRSFSMLQTDGSFVVSCPIINKVIWYPQSPNNPSYTLMQNIIEFTSFDDYGDLKWPMDAQVDSARRILYIVDSGNNNVLKIDLNAQTIIKTYSINNPISVTVNPNTGDFFIRYILSDSKHGIIYYKNDNIQENIEFPHYGPYPISLSGYFLKNIVSSNSVTFYLRPSLARSKSA